VVAAAAVVVVYRHIRIGVNIYSVQRRENLATRISLEFTVEKMRVFCCSVDVGVAKL
jgi:hypothetical protein